MRSIFIYLSGSVKKSNSDSRTLYWSEEHIQELTQGLLKEEINVFFLNPSSRSDDLSDEKSLFGRDMLQVYLSDCILVDARQDRGIGIGYEMAFANFKKIPVISWSPFDSHYRPKQIELLGQNIENWTHPFIKNPSNLIVEDLKQAVQNITSLKYEQRKPLYKEDFTFIPILHYIKTQLKKDKEMDKIVNGSDILKKRIEQITLLDEEAKMEFSSVEKEKKIKTESVSESLIVHSIVAKGSSEVLKSKKDGSLKRETVNREKGTETSKDNHEKIHIKTDSTPI